jgi:branched-chain amino acid transport system substrate-binding protein
VLIVYGYPNASAIITRQAKQLGLKSKIYGANSAGGRNIPKSSAKPAGTLKHPVSEVLPEGDDPAAAKFRANFEKAFSRSRASRAPGPRGCAQLWGRAGVSRRPEANWARADPSSFRQGAGTLKGFETGLTLPDDLQRH